MVVTITCFNKMLDSMFGGLFRCVYVMIIFRTPGGVRKFQIVVMIFICRKYYLRISNLICDLKLGICLACSYHCHDGHEMVELYTKRNFKCDCGTPRFVTRNRHFSPFQLWIVFKLLLLIYKPQGFARSRHISHAPILHTLKTSGSNLGTHIFICNRYNVESLSCNVKSLTG